MNALQRCNSCGCKLFYLLYEPTTFHAAKVMSICNQCFEKKDIYMRHKKVSKKEKLRMRIKGD